MTSANSSQKPASADFFPFRAEHQRQFTPNPCGKAAKRPDVGQGSTILQAC
jgi:hypothetical protein